MSTKIFNGYRLSGAACPLDVVSDLRARIRPVYRTLYLTVAAQLAATAADALLAGEPIEAAAAGTDSGWRHTLTEARSPLLFAVAVLDQTWQRIRATGRRDAALDLQCEVVFLADPADRQHLYALLYAEAEPYRETFEDMTGVTAWPYWNSTDRPDNITEAEWEHRRQVWDRVLGDDPPARRGLVWSLLGDFHSVHPTAGEVLDYLPSRAARARAVARRQVLAAAVSERDPDVLRRRIVELAAPVAGRLPELDADLLRHVPATV